MGSFCRPFWRRSALELRNDAKAETPVLWPPHAKSWLIGKDSDAGRDSGQEEKGTKEDEMTGWHHGLDGRESEWTPGVGNGQGGLACCNSWGHKELDTTERLNWTELKKKREMSSFALWSAGNLWQHKRQKKASKDATKEDVLRGHTSPYSLNSKFNQHNNFLAYNPNSFLSLLLL